MNINRIEKLENLIKLSSILNSQEREEWLQLLELMNDKQMLELEKILASSGGAVVSSQQPLPQSLPRLDSESKRASKGEGGVVHLPPLSHIINLPQAQVSKSQFPFSHLKEAAALKPPASTGKVQKSYQEVSAPPSLREEGKVGSGFWQKIKDVLAEKELPAGHKEAMEELELPDPTRLQASPPHEPALSADREGKGEVVAKARQISKPSMTPSISPSGHPKFPKGKLGETPTSRGGESLKVPVPLAKRPQPASSTETTAKIAKAILAKKPGGAQEEFELSSQAAGIKSGIQPEQVAVAELLKKRVAIERPSKLQSLSDLAQLRPDDFDEDSFPSLSKKIKALVLSFNYHQVMFNLEKSPLYKAYVNTGMQVLSQKGDFGQLIQKSPGEFLSQEEFERFADLLMEIQRG